MTEQEIEAVLSKNGITNWIICENLQIKINNLNEK